MSRFYLDTMVFIQWFERSSPNQVAIDQLFAVIENGRHELLTSLFVEGELLVLPVKNRDEFSIASIRRFFRRGRARIVPLDHAGVEIYAELRARHRVKALDALHLAVAGRAGVDVFVTEDRQLQGLRVPGIGQIAAMDAVTL